MNRAVNNNKWRRRWRHQRLVIYSLVIRLHSIPCLDVGLLFLQMIELVAGIRCQTDWPEVGSTVVQHLGLEDSHASSSSGFRGRILGRTPGRVRHLNGDESVIVDQVVDLRTVLTAEF